MGHGGKFDSVKLSDDGTVKVAGPFTVSDDEARKPAVVVFYLVQGDTKIEGEGRWEPGATEWTGTGAKGLTTGDAQAAAFAVLALDNPPAFGDLQLVRPGQGDGSRLKD